MDTHEAERAIRRITRSFGTVENMMVARAEFSALAEQPDTKPEIAKILRECVANVDRYAADYHAATLQVSQ